ncbi:MAG: hypothetical protein KGK01_01715 [Bradyrhizobium sp.]|nr:hypothetical protein [Pseudomonadota bacterium]MDE2066982.1 hypothetical protein [Bradyrhizobium sp.]MDE2241183.1 hypothetical protein [Bradyrhizobium sp.]
MPRAPGISLRPSFSGERLTQDSGASRRENAKLCHIVVARLDRAIQYSETAMIEAKDHGLLDTRFRGYDAGMLHHRELKSEQFAIIYSCK